MPIRAVPARARANVLSKPQEGVYTLLPATQAKMGVLLRLLFSVQATSDTSAMAFLGIAHYMMAFSHCIGINASDARVAFFEDLTTAFQEPLAMKHFMETAFECGRRGVHVRGRTASKRHVVGQLSGLREDILRSHINPGNVKVQWVSRRLSLRKYLDEQLGAHSVSCGLSASDRDFFGRENHPRPGMVRTARAGVHSQAS